MDLDRKNVFLFFKGRVALYAILRAMKIGPGDEVILPGYTCVVVPNAITYLGAKPVYIDIDPITYNIDPKKIEENCGKNWHPSNTKAIIVQHTYGIPAEMNKIMAIAKKYNLYIIEDCCHSIDSKYNGKEIGTFGEASFYSSQWSKIITTGLGGWAVINNKKVRENIKNLHSEFKKPSWKQDWILRIQYSIYSQFFKPSIFWFAQEAYRKLSNYGIALGSSSKNELQSKKPMDYEQIMSEWQSNLLKKKISELNENVMHRKRIVSIYEARFKEKALNTLQFGTENEFTFLRYPILVNDKLQALVEAKRINIELGDWFLSPIHPNLNGWKRVGYSKNQCPISEKICRHVINLPTHSKIGVDSAEKTIDFISPFIAAYADIK